MTLSELPQTIQDELIAKRKELHNTWKRNDSYHILFTNEEGTRYFQADRISECYTDNKGNYMPFGGGSYWKITYGKILWNRRKQPMGCEYDYYWTTSSSTFSKSKNGTIIPKTLSKKSEVLELAKRIGTLKI